MSIRPAQFWVSNPGFSVDTEELLEVTASMQQARQLVADLRRRLLLNFPVLVAHVLLVLPAVGAALPVVARLQKIVDRIGYQLGVLEEQILRQQFYREQAVAIYAAAEGTVSSYLATCDQFQALRCSAGTGLKTATFLAEHSVSQSLSGVPGMSALSATSAGLDGWSRGLGTGISLVETAFRLPGMFNMQNAKGDEALMHRHRVGNLSKFMFGGEVQDAARKIEPALTAIYALGSGQPVWRGVALAGQAPDVNKVPGVSTVRTPTSVAALVKRVGSVQAETAPGYGRVEVLRHSISAASPRPSGVGRYTWTVVIPGTNSWNPAGHSPQDGLTNLQALQNKESAQKKAVEEAMRQAGIKPGDPVEIVGHSQGGMVAAQLATDPNSKFNVVSVLTAGSPVTAIENAAASTAEELNLLHLEDLRDLVPALDADYNSLGTTVYALPDGKTSLSAHAVENYQQIAHELDNSIDPTKQSAVGQWLSRREELMKGDKITKTVSMQFDLRRQ